MDVFTQNLNTDTHRYSITMIFHKDFAVWGPLSTTVLVNQSNLIDLVTSIHEVFNKIRTQR